MREYVWFALRHPLKTIGVGIGFLLESACVSDVQWLGVHHQVQSGESTTDHQFAEGIEH